MLGLLHVLVHPFKLYVIVFVTSVAVGVYVWFATILVHVFGELWLLHDAAVHE